MLHPGTGHPISLGETLPFLLQSRSSGEGSQSQTLSLPPQAGRANQGEAAKQVARALYPLSLAWTPIPSSSLTREDLTLTGCTDGIMVLVPGVGKGLGHGDCAGHSHATGSSGSRVASLGVTLPGVGSPFSIARFLHDQAAPGHPKETLLNARCPMSQLGPDLEAMPPRILDLKTGGLVGGVRAPGSREDPWVSRLGCVRRKSVC